MGEVLGSSHRGRNVGRGFENRVLQRIFEPKRDGVTEQWRKVLYV